MKSPVTVVLGVVLAVVGSIWALQGMGVVGGSPMSGVIFWAVTGSLMSVLGLVLVARGARRRRTGSGSSDTGGGSSEE